MFRHEREQYLGAITGLPDNPTLNRAVDSNLQDVAVSGDGIVLSEKLAEILGVGAEERSLRVGGGGSFLLSSPIQRIFRDAQAGALMAYSVPLTQQVVGEAVLSAD